MSKKREMTFLDKLSWYGLCVAIFLSFAVCTPILPWNISESYAGFHQRFPERRYSSPVMVTNARGTYMMWSQIQRIVCAQHRDWIQPDLVGDLVGLVGGAMKVGGSTLGCPNWEECKRHVGVRCRAYQELSIGGMMVMCFYVCGMLAVCFALMSMYGEFEEKKQRKIKAAAQKVSEGAIAACTFNLFALGLYAGITTKAFGDMKATAAFTYPAAGPGFYVALACLLCHIMAGVAAYQRLKEIPAEDESAGKDQQGGYQQGGYQQGGYQQGGYQQGGYQQGGYGYEQGGYQQDPLMR